MMTFEQFLQNKTAGAFGRIRNNNPTLLVHNNMKKGIESDASITNRLGKSTIQRSRQKEKTSLLPSTPSIGAAPGKQTSITNFGRKPPQFFRKEPKIKNVPIPKSLQ